MDSAEISKEHVHVSGQTHRKHSATHVHGSLRPSTEKKHGAGSHNWGTLGQIETPLAEDPDDPNYDPDEHVDRIVSVDVALTGPEIESLVEPLVKEYFDTGDTADIATALAKINISQSPHIVAETLVLLSLDRTDVERELASKLIALLTVEHVFPTPAVVERAFNNLLTRVSDLKLDNPDAPELLGKFLARAVADDCLAPAFVRSHPASSGDFANPHVRAAIKKAHTLMSVSHAMARLDDIWGHNGGHRSVETLKEGISAFLGEYLLSKDGVEAQRCLKELGAPHFHHEVVYEAVLAVLERPASPEITELVIGFLSAAAESNVITPNQLDTGVSRVLKSLDDLTLDVPNARKHLETFLNRCDAVGFTIKAASRADRKRYLSEGDGGQIKS